MTPVRRNETVRPLAAPVPGFQLIEASAGTGKTYSITNQYILLLLETGLRVDEILVVTYTEAATAELRDRIRTRIRDIHDALLAGDLEAVEDEPLREFLQGFLDSDDAKRQAARRLDSALICFDEAAIFTIHGFCHRVLAENAFAAGIDFEVEVVQSELPMLESAVADFVRNTLSKLSEKEYRAFVEHSPLVDGVGKGEWNAPGRLLLSGSLRTLAKIVTNPLLKLVPPEQPHAGGERSDEEIAMDLTWRLIEHARRELPARKLEAGVISYSDMLLGVWNALQGPHRERLKAELRSSLKAALIDEFQDTNPLQYEIFRIIFDDGKCPVVFVGDPKQAIFAFQGGDVFAYFDATKSIPEERRRTLEVNYRSASALVDGITGIFTGLRKNDIFLDGDRSTFPPVRAHSVEGKEPRMLPKKPAGRGAVHWLLMPETEKRLKPEAAAMAIGATVEEIALLLSEANKKPAKGDALMPGDIAVLVRTNAMAAQVHDALTLAGIPSVVKARGDVFETVYAGELLLVLRAIAEPRSESALAAALLSPLLGYTADRLVQLREDADAYEAIVSSFVDLQRLWLDRECGFMPMAMHLLHQPGFAAEGRSVIEQLGRTAFSERALTDALHLLELLHQESFVHPDPQHLIDWMERMVADPGSEGGEHPIRLESDEKRVQVVTIHSSKGLEYPVVFCPFMWEGKGYKEEAIVFCHEQTMATGKQERTAFIGDLGSEDLDQHAGLAKREQHSENLRLLYVALTRARQRCYLVWGQVNQMHQAALPWLLFPKFDGESRTLKEYAHDDVVEPVKRLCTKHAPGMTWSEIKPGSKGGVRSAGVKDAEKPVPLRARVFEGREVSRAWTFASYTSLTSTWSRSPRDRDAVAVEAPPIEQDSKTIFAFPPGARTGIVWHSLFEQLNFRAADEELRTIASGIPKRAGAPTEFAPAVFGMMKSALIRPITPDGGRLCDLSDDRCIREFEFTFSLPAFRTDAVVKVLQNPANKLHLPFREASSALARMDLSGFMTGAIDLLFEWNGKYYIADYKSNNLGGTPERYAAGPLADVMAREQYYLQYLIYAVAVHRFLSQKLPGYEYEKHFGGVAYLFLRGMAADGEAGVFFDRPDRALIEALEAALCGRRVS